MFKFDLQRFGKGGTSVNYAPPQEKQMSEQEKGLLQQQYDFNDKIKTPMFNLVDMANTALNGTSFNPAVDYKQMYDTANQQQTNAMNSYNQNVSNFQNLAPEYQAQQNKSAALADESKNMNAGYQSQLQGINGKYDNLDQKYGALDQQYGAIGQKFNNLDQSYQDLNGQYSALDQKYAGLDPKYAELAPQYQALARGELPSAYVDNKKAVLADVIGGTLGEALNAGSRKGVINSSISNDVNNKLGTWANRSMNESFNNDINTVSGLIGAQGNIYDKQASLYGQEGNVYGQQGTLLGQQGNMYTQQGNMLGQQGNLYGQEASLYDKQAGNINSAATIGNTDITNRNQMLSDQTNLIGNRQNVYGQAGQMNQTQIQNALVPMQTATQAQDASLSYPGKLIQMALGTYQPGADLYKTEEASRLAMSTPGQYYATQQASPWGAIGSIGGSLIACFPAGTKICGQFCEDILVENLKVGDTICTVRNRKMTPDKVTIIKKTPDQDVLEIEFEYGFVRCTPTQGVFTDEGIVDAGKLVVGDFAITACGLKKIKRISELPKQTVYDIGTKDFHTVLANSVLMEVW